MPPFEIWRQARLSGARGNKLGITKPDHRCRQRDWASLFQVFGLLVRSSRLSHLPVQVARGALLATPLIRTLDPSVSASPPFS
jgi:hypothetical protein